jgi:nicotinate-nucleotide pyrophosphorylase (carboxylating)
MNDMLHPDAFLSPLVIEEAVARAPAEDLGCAGDVTSTAKVPAGTAGRAVVAARQAGVTSAHHRSGRW